MFKMQIQVQITEVYIQKVRYLGAYNFNKYKIKGYKICL